MTRWRTPECVHSGPGACQVATCRYHEPHAHERCTLSHVAAFGPMTLEQVAAVTGVTREAVRQREQRAVQRLAAKLGPEYEEHLRSAEARPTEARDAPNYRDLAEISTELHRRAVGSGERGFLAERRRRSGK